MIVIPVVDLGEGLGDPGLPLVWVKKEEMTEGRKAGRAEIKQIQASLA